MKMMYVKEIENYFDKKLTDLEAIVGKSTKYWDKLIIINLLKIFTKWLIDYIRSLEIVYETNPLYLPSSNGIAKCKSKPFVKF